MISPTVIAFNAFSIGPIGLPCIISERHESDLVITDYPVESGAQISDHAFREAKRLSLEVADQNAAIAFNALVLFQESRIPFYMVTGLTIYSNMLIERITARRDITTSTILSAQIDLKEVIIVQTATGSISGQDAGPTPSGQPGGKNSTSAANPTGDISPDAGANTVQKGDSSIMSVYSDNSPSQAPGSYLNQLIGNGL